MPSERRQVWLTLLSIALAAGLEDGSAPFYAALTAAADVANSTGVLVKLEAAMETVGARCLDGTPGAYYIRKGAGTGANKWYIHHQGGGWCESLDDCLRRSKGGLGSSTGYAPTTSGMGGGYFSPLPSVNPMMYNWNSVYLQYCDGGSFSGNNDTVTVHKNTSLYFRGKRIREASYASLLASGLTNATDVVISGCSAGGLATFLHTDQWCDALAADAPSAKCVGLPDSGFFLDYQSTQAPGRAEASSRRRLTTLPGDYHAGLKWCFEAFNATAGVNQDCIAAHGTGGFATDSPPYLCMFAEHTAVFTHTPIFALQSEYDSWQTGHVLHPGDAVQLLGDNLTKRIGGNLVGPHPSSGAFLDSCHHHCGSWNDIRIDGQLVSEAFAQWYDAVGTKGPKKPKRIWKQDQAYPCDRCCKP